LNEWTALKSNSPKNRKTSFASIESTLDLVTICILTLGILDVLTLVYSRFHLHPIERIFGYVTLVIMFLTTFRFVSAHRSFKKIVTTSGHDDTLLFSSLRQLNGELIGDALIIIAHIVGTFAFHEMMFGPYSSLNNSALTRSAVEAPMK